MESKGYFLPASEFWTDLSTLIYNWTRQRTAVSRTDLSYPRRRWSSSSPSRSRHRSRWCSCRATSSTWSTRRRSFLLEFDRNLLKEFEIIIVYLTVNNLLMYFKYSLFNEITKSLKYYFIRFIAKLIIKAFPITIYKLVENKSFLK